MIVTSFTRYTVRVVVYRQNTAYDIGISDWSSDVCSSDLPGPATAHLGRRYLRETPMTDRVREFLRTTRPEGPCLVVDLEEVRRNYLALERALPDKLGRA